MQQDKEIFSLIEDEKKRQQEGIELIASENFTSKQVMKAMGSCLTNKYAEGLPGKRYYGGCEVVDNVENLAIDRLKKLFGAVWVNVQPHSGAQANAAVMLAVLNAGDTILGFDLSHGGHLTHGSGVNFSGKLYKPTFYGVDKKTGLIDMNHVEEMARKSKPKLIICGASAYARDWNFEEFRRIADDVGAILLGDISHVAGLVATGIHSNPLPYCHVVTSTTHKTLRGPRGGVIMIGQDFDNPFGVKNAKGTLKKMSELLDSGVFPGTQGGPLEHIIAAKAVAFKEALDASFTQYCSQVIKNAKTMANAFLSKGYQLVSNGTDNHLMLIDLRNKNISGKAAEKALENANITVNKNMVPFDDKSPFVTSGIRIGTPAITTRGMKEDEMIKIVDWIDILLSNPLDNSLAETIRNEVIAFTKQFPLYA